MFITTFDLFSMSEMGDFVKLLFSNGIDKIETTHDHAPEIKLSNGKRIDVSLVKNLTLTYDMDRPISQIK